MQERAKAKYCERGAILQDDSFLICIILAEIGRKKHSVPVILSPFQDLFLKHLECNVLYLCISIYTQSECPSLQ